MARDTDRKIISEALRVYGKDWEQNWGEPDVRLDLFNSRTTEEMSIHYNANGRIKRLIVWDLVRTFAGGTTLASRTDIYTYKRNHVLKKIGAVR